MTNYNTRESQERRDHVHVVFSSVLFPSNTFGNGVYNKALGTAVLISHSDEVGGLLKAPDWKKTDHEFA